MAAFGTCRALPSLDFSTASLSILDMRSICCRTATPCCELSGLSNATESTAPPGFTVTVERGVLWKDGLKLNDEREGAVEVDIDLDGGGKHKAMSPNEVTIHCFIRVDKGSPEGPKHAMNNRCKTSLFSLSRIQKDNIMMGVVTEVQQSQCHSFVFTFL